MSDITIVWDSAAIHGDWAIEDHDLLVGADLATAMLISIFSDAMAAPDERIPDGSGDPRGWWGDQFDQGNPIGSKIWLLDREKQTKETLNKAYDYIAECLQWLIDDGVVSRFDIQVQWVRDSFLGAQVVAVAPNGTALHSGEYLWAWNGVT
jgi:phage gp46-like protein